MEERLETFLRNVLASKATWIFACATLLRGLPEILTGSYPAGFDLTTGYLAVIQHFPDFATLRLFGWASSPTVPLALWFVHAVTGIDSLLELKIVGPIFYGFLNVSFLQMLRKGLGWSARQSLLTSLFFLMEIPILRIGWDQLRLEIGLALLFLMIALNQGRFALGSVKTKTTSVLSLLIALTQQLVGTLLFIIILWNLVASFQRKSQARAFGVYLPFLVTMLGVFYIDLFLPYGDNAQQAVLRLPSGTGNRIFVNYFFSDPLFLNGSFWTVLSYVGSLSLLTCLPLMLPAIRGFYKDSILTPSVVWLGVASFSILGFPSFALQSYWWWMLLLPIPMTIFAARGFMRTSFLRRKWLPVLILCIMALTAVAYSSSMLHVGNQYTQVYIPTHLVSNSVEPWQVDDTFQALGWIQTHVPAGSMVLVQEKFDGFALSTLRNHPLVISPSILSLSQGLSRFSTQILKWPLYAFYDASLVDTSQSLTSDRANFGQFVVVEILGPPI